MKKLFSCIALVLLLAACAGTPVVAPGNNCMAYYPACVNQ